MRGTRSPSQGSPVIGSRSGPTRCSMAASSASAVYAPLWRSPLMKKARGAVHAAAHAVDEVALDLRQEAVLLEVAREATHVEPQVGRVRQQRGCLEVLLVLEEQVVHLPEPSLRAGGLRGLRGQQRVRVELGEREVAEDEADPVSDSALEPLQLPVGASTEGALESRRTPGG